MWFIALSVGRISGRAEGEARSYSQIQSTYAANKIKDCYAKPIVPIEECVADAIKTERADNRDEYDLAAQRQMAEWAKQLLGLSFIQLIVGGIGVGSVIFTIMQTQEVLKRAGIANKIAEDTANRQLRAYVTTEDHAIAGFWRNGPTVLHLKVWNRGQTPAYNVRIWSTVTGTLVDPDNTKIFKKVDQNFRQSRAVIGPGQSIVHDNDCQSPLDEAVYIGVVLGEIKLVYGGVVTYRDAFGKRHFTTFKQFFVGDGSWNQRSDDLMACGRGNVAS